MEVGKYTIAHSTKDALANSSKQYRKYTFKRTSINSQKASFKNNGNSQNLKKIGQPNLFSEKLLKKAKDIIIGSRLAGTFISRSMVIAIGTGVVKANNPDTIVQNDRIQILQYSSEQQVPPLLFLNTYMWLIITLIIGTLVLFLEQLKFLQTYKSCFYNYTLFAYQNVVLRSKGD